MGTPLFDQFDNDARADAGNVQPQISPKKTRWENYKARRARGLCQRCDNPPDLPSRLCATCKQKCNQYSNEYAQKRRQSRERFGVCAGCGAERENLKFKHCGRCRRKNKHLRGKHRLRARMEGRCTTCAQERDDHCQVCSACRKKNKEFRDGRSGLGLCVRCDAPGEVQTKYMHCMKCWLKVIAALNTGTSKNWTVLKELFEEQGGRCAYTGIVLTPGKDASVDHKTPTTRGGTNEKSNLQWVARTINRVKNDCTHEEFLVLCADIAVRFDLCDRK